MIEVSGGISAHLDQTKMSQVVIKLTMLRAAFKGLDFITYSKRLNVFRRLLRT